jgi:hypothetical protein
MLCIRRVLQVVCQLPMMIDEINCGKCFRFLIVDAVGEDGLTAKNYYKRRKLTCIFK